MIEHYLEKSNLIFCYCYLEIFVWCTMFKYK